MQTYQNLLEANKAWAKGQLDQDISYFDVLASGQQPDFLWIGCSDSRVPAESVTGAKPGEIFVHRNIANLVINTDMNLLSVLQYAVEVLKVKHVIVCGHYGCGGVKSAQTANDLGLINHWLRSIKDIYAVNETELDALPEGEARTNRLVELSVVQQVKNLAKTGVIQTAWKREQRPMIHGWVFGLDSGLITELVTLDHTYEMPAIYRFDISDEVVPYH
ncbi:carbonate dehydratase [Spirosoma luteolum]